MVNSLLEQLRRDGHRITRAREAFLKVLSTSVRPLAVSDLLSELDAAGVRINKTTAYRELEFLMARGLVSSVDFGDGSKRFELVEGEHHHHFVCTSCDKVAELEIETRLASVLRAVVEQTGAKVTGHAVEFFGLCQSCV